MITSSAAPAPAFVKARRGDAIVVHERRTTYVIGQQPPALPYDTFEVGIVTSVSREGLARKWRPAWVRDDHEDYSGGIPAHSALYILPAASFDITAVLRAARGHSWPGHPEQVKPFGSADEVRAAMRPCRKER